MAGTIRYCTTEDGVRLAYSVEGDGPVLDGPLHGQAAALLGALGFEHVKVVFEEPPET